MRRRLLRAGRLAKKVDELAAVMERLRLEEYIKHLDNRRKFLTDNFYAGLLRGIGMALGFTVLGGVVVLILRELAARNLPVIGKFIADLVKIVTSKM